MPSLGAKCRPNAALPLEPSLDDESPNRLSFREPSREFFEGHRAWQEIIDSENNEELLNDLRWSIMFKEWKLQNPLEQLHEIISARGSEIKEIEEEMKKMSKIHDLLATHGSRKNRIEELTRELQGIE
ncbi:HET-domain-containing protein [Penicillium malachiteum]|nr:HET-domain-containing protein [Penicillium malachiteum]